MNVTFTKCRAKHLHLIKPAPNQRLEYTSLLSEESGRVIEASASLTAWHGTTAIAAGGLISYWPGRAEAWLLAGERARPFMRPLLRAMRSALDNSTIRRVEMTVQKENNTGHKFADLLGFVFEAELEAYHPSGGDVVLYKRIRK